MGQPCEELKEKIQEWLAWDQNPKTRATIQNLQNTQNYNDLGKILLNRLSFGTAGLRGKMCAGYAAMNDLVIIQTGQGVLRFLEKNENVLLNTNGIVIGYDGRYNSRRYLFKLTIWLDTKSRF